MSTDKIITGLVVYFTQTNIWQRMSHLFHLCSLMILLLVAYYIFINAPLFKSIVPVSPNQIQAEIIRSESTRLIISVLREQLDASRLVLFHFHDGTPIGTHRHFIFKSAEVESMSPDLSSIIRELQRIPISSISSIPSIIQKKCFDEQPSQSNAISRVSSHGTSFILSCPLTYEGNVAGMMVATFAREKHPTEENIRYFETMLPALSAIVYRPLKSTDDQVKSFLLRGEGLSETNR
jgi:hypothetical protein